MIAGLNYREAQELPAEKTVAKKTRTHWAAIRPMSFRILTRIELHLSILIIHQEDHEHCRQRVLELSRRSGQNHKIWTSGWSERRTVPCLPGIGKQVSFPIVEIRRSGPQVCGVLHHVFRSDQSYLEKGLFLMTSVRSRPFPFSFHMLSLKYQYYSPKSLNAPMM